MGQKHLTLPIREVIERLLRRDKSINEIARIIGYSSATVSLEIRRNGKKSDYFALLAHQKATRRRAKASKKYRKRFSEETKDYVKKKLKSYWSPEQIVGRMPLDLTDSSRAVSYCLS